MIVLIATLSYRVSPLRQALTQLPVASPLHRPPGARYQNAFDHTEGEGISGSQELPQFSLLATISSSNLISPSNSLRLVCEMRRVCTFAPRKCIRVRMRAPHAVTPSTWQDRRWANRGRRAGLRTRHYKGGDGEKCERGLPHLAPSLPLLPAPLQG